MWGYGSAEVVNLFAWRTTHPKELRTETTDPVGPLNDVAIVEAGKAVDVIVAAWGNHGQIQNRLTGVPRSDEVRTILDESGVRLRCLKMTGKSQPGHPLYIPSHIEPADWI